MYAVSMKCQKICYASKKHGAAFSLVELSIVLVILGLLVGGVLTGQSLIRAAELRGVATEFQQFQTATQTFRDRFFALPGDMRNAEAFWGTMSAGTCPNATGGTGPQTCNGNGDGVILGAAPSGGQAAELFTFWQHLANAGLIEGSYTGIAGTDGDTSVIGENSPRSRVNNAGWSASGNDTTYIGDAVRYSGDYGNFFIFGAPTTSGPSLGRALTPEEAWNVDTKMDDGLPGQGIILARFWDNSCATASSNSDISAPYNLSTTGILCALYFRNVF